MVVYRRGEFSSVAPRNRERERERKKEKNMLSLKESRVGRSVKKSIKF